MTARKLIEIDDLIWMVHKEILARVGKGKQFSVAVGHEKGNGWSIRLPAGGRPLHPDVLIALRDVEREFQLKYAIPKAEPDD